MSENNRGDDNSVKVGDVGGDVGGIGNTNKNSVVGDGNQGVATGKGKVKVEGEGNFTKVENEGQSNRIAIIVALIAAAGAIIAAIIMTMNAAPK